MKVEKSDIKYIHFGVLELKFNCVIPKSQEDPISDPEIDLTYSVYNAEEDKNVFQIALDLVILPIDKQPGYHIVMKTFGVFELLEGWDKKNKDIALISTCLPMVIGSTRGFIADVSSNYPMGRYQFPAISMKDIRNAQAPDKDE